MTSCKKYKSTPAATQHNQQPQADHCNTCVYFSQSNCGNHINQTK